MKTKMKKKESVPVLSRAESPLPLPLPLPSSCRHLVRRPVVLLRPARSLVAIPEPSLLLAEPLVADEVHPRPGLARRFDPDLDSGGRVDRHVLVRAGGDVPPSVRVGRLVRDCVSCDARVASAIGGSGTRPPSRHSSSSPSSSSSSLAGTRARPTGSARGARGARPFPSDPPSRLSLHRDGLVLSLELARKASLRVVEFAHVSFVAARAARIRHGVQAPSTARAHRALVHYRRGGAVSGGKRRRRRRE